MGMAKVAEDNVLDPKSGASPLPEGEDWFRADNAGRIFAALSHWQTSSIFRVSARLKRPVSYERLQASLERVMERFPYFQVRLRQGFFWSFFERSDRVPSVVADSRFPCNEFKFRNRRSMPFRVRAFHKNDVLEVAHVLTDGTGALIFLQALLAEYLGLNEEGGNLEEEAALRWLRPGDTPDAEEFEDACRRYYCDGLPPKSRMEPAFRIPGEPEARGIRHLTTGIFSASDVLAVSKKNGVTLGEFLISAYLFSLQELYYDLGMGRRTKKGKDAPIRLDVPVNLRTHLPSKTMRNFFLSTFPEIDPRLGEYQFDEILYCFQL